MWYTVQQLGYFDALPTSGRRSQRGGKMFILRGGKSFSKKKSSVTEPNKIDLNKDM
jgi:hypothetical protein